MSQVVGKLNTYKGAQARCGFALFALVLINSRGLRLAPWRGTFYHQGVVSSLGKGLASALGALLQARGYKVRLRKLDPYSTSIRNDVALPAW